MTYLSSPPSRLPADRRDNRPGPSAHGRLERGGRFFFAISHLFFTFDLGNEATMLHLREKPDNCSYFRNGVAAFIFIIFVQDLNPKYHYAVSRTDTGRYRTIL